MDIALQILPVSGGILDTGDVGDLRQLSTGLGCNVVAGTGGHIIHNDGQVHCFGNCLVVLVYLLLGNRGKVGADDGQDIDAQSLCLQRQLDGRFGAGAAGTGINRNPAGDFVHNNADDLQLLLLGLDVEFAVGSQAENCVNTGSDLTVDLMADLGLVQRLIRVHGCDHSGNNAVYILVHCVTSSK